MSDDTSSKQHWTPDLGRLTGAADDSFSVRRVFGEPYEHADRLVVPVAKVWGMTGQGSGGGGGSGSGTGTGSGSTSGTGRGAVPTLRRKSAAASTDVAIEGGGSSSTGGVSLDGPTADANGELSGDAKGQLNGDAHGEGGGGGGGFGVRVKALGVYVVDADGVRWQPALDLNRVILGGQVVGVAAALAIGWAVGRRRR